MDVADIIKRAEETMNLIKGFETPKFGMPRAPIASLRLPEVESPFAPLLENVEESRAGAIFAVLLGQMDRFHDSLDDEHEVGLRLVNFGETITFHVEDMSYSDPSLLIFNGYRDDGSPVELIQHVSQLSIALVNVTRSDSSVPKMGFAAALLERREREQADQSSYSDPT